MPSRLPDVPALGGGGPGHRADDGPHVPVRGGAGRSDHGRTVASGGARAHGSRPYFEVGRVVLRSGVSLQRASGGPRPLDAPVRAAPSTTNSEPVENDASSLARKASRAITRCVARGSPGRLIHHRLQRRLLERRRLGGVVEPPRRDVCDAVSGCERSEHVCRPAELAAGYAAPPGSQGAGYVRSTARRCELSRRARSLASTRSTWSGRGLRVTQ